jgi:hypothetical protein
MIALPDGSKTSTLMTSMMRRDVKAVAIKPVPTSELVVAGVYADHQKKIIGACFADKALTIYAGSALSLIPPEAAADAMKEKELDENMVDNFGEVLNVCSRMIKMPGDARLVLVSKDFSPAPWSQTAQDALAKATQRVDFDVDISRYGKGRLVVTLVPA